MLALLLALGCTTPEPRPPDVLLVVLDTTRADRLGTYGGREDVSFQLDQIAAAGVAFEQAHVPATWTWPGHASLFTGEPPWVHGAHFDPDPVIKAEGQDPWAVRKLREDLPTLAERFAAAGYRTEAVFANGHLLPELGLTRGFAEATHGATDGEVLQAAISAMQDREDDRPLFLFVNLMSAHSPYVEVEGVPWSEAALGALEADWAAPYRLEQEGRTIGLITAKLGAEGQPSLEAAYALGQVAIPPEGVEAIRTLYDGELVRLDKALRGLVGAWNEAGRGAGVVAVTSDHGEHLGEQQLLGHGRIPNPELTHVPLVLAAPGRLPAGVRVAAPVGAERVYGALLALSGVDEDADGALITAAKGSPPSDPVQAAAWPDAGWIRDHGPAHKRFLRAYRRGERWLLLEEDGSHRCFDLSADPQRLSPLPDPGCPELAAEAAVAFPMGPETPVMGLGDVEGDTLEQLRAMGYVD